MAEQRRDYLLQQTELLRQFVARLIRDRDGPRIDEALHLAFSLQERLFPIPAAEFLQLEASEQVSRLLAGESPTRGREKCETYATLLAESASLYELRGRADLSVGARQLALHIALLVAPKPADKSAQALVSRLRESLGGETLHAPVAQLLADYERQLM